MLKAFDCRGKLTYDNGRQIHSNGQPGRQRQHLTKRPLAILVIAPIVRADQNDVPVPLEETKRGPHEDAGDQSVDYPHIGIRCVPQPCQPVLPQSLAPAVRHHACHKEVHPPPGVDGEHDIARHKCFVQSAAQAIVLAHSEPYEFTKPCVELSRC